MIATLGDLLASGTLQVWGVFGGYLLYLAVRDARRYWKREP